MESKKVIEALVVGGVLAISLANQSAFATLACSATGTPASISAGTFVKQGFTPKCSANVSVDYSENSATSFSVCGASMKGAHKFGGSTEGGQVSAGTSMATMTDPAAGSTGCS